MNTLEIISFKKTLEDYINKQEMPKEVVRLVLKEIYDNVSKASLEEALNEMRKEENDNDRVSSDKEVV